LTARYEAWEYRWNGWFVKQPLIGSGVGSVSLGVDNEYLLRACEVGVVGFLLFVWWLATIWRQAKWLRTASGLPQVLGVGVTAGFVALLIQGTVAASFTTIRTMEPFWFLLGLACASIILTRRIDGSVLGTVGLPRQKQAVLAGPGDRKCPGGHE
jgi:hypothetical protein